MVIDYEFVKRTEAVSSNNINENPESPTSNPLVQTTMLDYIQADKENPNNPTRPSLFDYEEFAVTKAPRKALKILQDQFISTPKKDVHAVIESPNVSFIPRNEEIENRMPRSYTKKSIKENRKEVLEILPSVLEKDHEEVNDVDVHLFEDFDMGTNPDLSIKLDLSIREETSRYRVAIVLGNVSLYGAISPINITESKGDIFSLPFSMAHCVSEDLQGNSQTSYNRSRPRMHGRTIKINTSFLFNKRIGFLSKNEKIDKKKSTVDDLSPSVSPDESLEISSNDDHTPENSPKTYRQESPENEALKQRQKNIQERDAYLASFMSDPNFAEAVQNVGIFSNKENFFISTHSTSRSKTVKRKRKEDENFRTSCKIPLDQRKSLRLMDKSPLFTYHDLPDETNSILKIKRQNFDYDDLKHLDDKVFQTKIRRKPSHRRPVERPTFLYVEDVTDAMLQNVSKRVGEKVYHSELGSSCHQCRQKTKDTKTFCRSKNCVGIRGQFCGVCLLNRYGEDATVALKDPSWHCPPCRGICNCSFCRAKEGKCPTGILTPLANKAGYNSVKELLDSLGGKGDFAVTKDPNALLGFTKDLDYAQLLGGQQVYVGFSTNLELKIEKV